MPLRVVGALDFQANFLKESSVCVVGRNCRVRWHNWLEKMWRARATWRRTERQNPLRPNERSGSAKIEKKRFSRLVSLSFVNISCCYSLLFLYLMEKDVYFRFVRLEQRAGRIESRLAYSPLEQFPFQPHFCAINGRSEIPSQRQQQTTRSPKNRRSRLTLSLSLFYCW